MIISLMMLVSNANLLGGAIVATDRAKGGSGYVVSKGLRAKLNALVHRGIEIVRGPDEWPFAL